MPVPSLWDKVLVTVQSAISGLQLPVRMFDAPYGHVVRRVLAEVVPQFVLSTEFREYIATLAAVRRSVLEVVPRVVPAQSYADLLFQAANRPLSASEFVRMGCSENRHGMEGCLVAG